MIDLHAHILPQVDDGSDSMEETMRMIAMAYEQGFRRIIATPHYRADGTNKSIEELTEILDQVRETAGNRFPGLSLGLGQEVQYFEGIVEALSRQEILTIAGSRYILVEFSYGASWNTVYRGVRKLLAAGYCPVIAHVERYAELRKEGRLEQLAGAGGILQMNFSSLTGKIWNSSVRWCRKQVLGGRIHVLSTDCHNSVSRKPDVREAMTWLQKSCSAGQIQEMTSRNAENMLKEKM